MSEVIEMLFEIFKEQYLYERELKFASVKREAENLQEKYEKK